MANTMAKYYLHGTLFPHEEDATHEFKGHRKICQEEIADMNEKTRKSVSRNICGFLNTGKGGTVYCGVDDTGIIMGIKLTQYQRDHVVGSLHDLMSRYTPPVPRDRYSIRFVPVLDSNIPLERREDLCMYDPKKHVDGQSRKALHLFRSRRRCWCDEDAKKMAFECGVIICDYIIEVIVHPWNADQCQGGIGDLLNVHPIYADEAGKFYFRRLASLRKYSLYEVTLWAELEASRRSQELIESLKNQIKELELSKDSSRQTSDSDNNDGESY
ncbi:uncharacterized protein LOC106068289 isoform X1 [Biomphalaria glabrata]|uniref:Uncharacterized protein LOC106068289 isoform X1 n=2 Tax=Biomphalaria glabrata TaxID=6526 RepID=A0A9U8EDG4_BIOGL|nr:uncharacterized protein LOC106068289 isoform X1 [Biomphalaria glabrata]